jgi:hypothetical protein
VCHPVGKNADQAVEMQRRHIIEALEPLELITSHIAVIDYGASVRYNVEELTRIIHS